MITDSIKGNFLFNILTKLATSIRTNPKPYAISSVAVILLGVYSTQFKPVTPNAIQNNAIDSRLSAATAFDEAALIKDQRSDLNGLEAQVTSFLGEDQQRLDIQMANQYIALATYYSMIPNHVCNGKSIIECLKTFEPNRVDELKNAAQTYVPTANDPGQMLNKMLNDNNVLAKIRALRLAIALSSPNKESWQEQLLNNVYPILQSGLPTVELKARPLTLAELISKKKEQEGMLLQTSSEATSQVESCLSMDETTRAKSGMCQ